MIRFWHVLALCCFAASAQAEDRLEAQRIGRNIPVGHVVSAADWLPAGPVWWHMERSRTDARWMRFRFTLEGPVPPGTILRILGLNSQELTYDLASRDQDQPLWTGIITGGRATLKITGPTRPGTMRLTLESMDIEATPGSVYSTHGTLDLDPVSDPDAPAAVARLQAQVAWLIMNHNAQPASCTGFLVADDMLLTNEHCMNAEDSCSSLTALFDDNVGQEVQFGCAELRPEWINPVLDAALVRLDGKPGERFGMTDLAGAADTSVPTNLFIVQHPGDEGKKVSHTDCAVTRLPAIGRGPDTDFTHTCDTASGSSGAPVYDHSGRLVGLHHFGFADNGAPDDWTENRAVRIAPLKAWLAEVLAPGNTPAAGDGLPIPAAFTGGCGR